MRLSSLLLGLAMVGLSIGWATAGCGGGETAVAAGSGGSGGSTGATGGSTGACAPTAACAAGHACLSEAENKDNPKPGFRMSQLTISKPKALASGIVASVVQGGVQPKLPACNVNGQATFNWLLQFDLAAMKLKTGGAKPVADASKGYDFIDEVVGGIHVQPVTVDATIGADGSFDTTMGTDLVVPIYLDAGATMAVILPLKQARLHEGTISADHDCIGHYNAEGLKPDDNCLATEAIPTFIGGAKIDGYITLEDADTVEISQLNETLCVLLSGDPGTFGENGKCKRTGGVIDFEGDWCSATNTAGGCGDAVSLGAEFAASAVLINN